MQKQVYSFDVFDTLITRVTGSPEIAFLLLGKRLRNLKLISVTPESFARLRTSAERRTRKNIGPGMALCDVYFELRQSLDLTKMQADKAAHQETILQCELLRPIPLLQIHLQKLRNRSSEVLFISDMYLSADFIEQQLRNHNIWREGDRCYVASEYGKSKSSEELFPEILRREKISPLQIVHFGNSLRADVKAANKAGIEATLFQEGNLNRYEQILESSAWATEGLSSLMAGASRLARLSVPASSAREVAIRDVTAGVVSPLLVGYVIWLLRRAHQLNLRRVYFLSRDGQVLLEIAKKIAVRLGISCELRYLYGSRLSWNRATIESTDESWVWSPLLKFCSLERLCSRLDLHQDEIITVLNESGFTRDDWQRSLDKKEIAQLRLVLNQPSIRNIIFRKAERKKKVLIQYFEQEGLLDSEKKGIVDLGWAGSLYNSLSRLIEDSGGQPIVGFYFGKSRSPKIDAESKRLEAYLFDERVKRGILISKIKNALELFCSADHGTTLGFEKKEGVVHPILETVVDQRVVDWGLPLLRQTVDCFVENLLLDPVLVDVYADTRECSVKAFKAFWMAPTQAEAEAWGDLPWDDHTPIPDKTLPRWARGYEWKDVVHLLLQGDYPRSHSKSWLRGSEARTPVLTLKALKYLAVLKREGFVEGSKKILK